MNKIALFLPSRGRPGSCRDCVDSFLSNSSGFEEIFVLLDSDDPKLEEYFGGFWGEPVHLMVGAPCRVGPKLNWAFSIFPNHPYYFLVGDDVRCKTPGWDNLMIHAIEGLEGLGSEPQSEGSGWGLAYGDDLHRGKDYANHYLISGNILRALGYFALEGLEHSFLDTVHNDICKAIGRYHYLPDIKIEHLHYSQKKSEFDETYKHSLATFHPGNRIYKQWRKNGFERDLAKVKAAMAGAKCESQ